MKLTVNTVIQSSPSLCYSINFRLLRNLGSLCLDNGGRLSVLSIYFVFSFFFGILVGLISATDPTRSFWSVAWKRLAEPSVECGQEEPHRQADRRSGSQRGKSTRQASLFAQPGYRKLLVGGGGLGWDLHFQMLWLLFPDRAWRQRQ